MEVWLYFLLNMLSYSDLKIYWFNSDDRKFVAIDTEKTFYHQSKIDASWLWIADNYC